MLYFSIALHISAIVMTLVEPQLWRWMLGAITANHAMLTALAMQPRGRLLGPNLSRLPVAATRRREIALTIDDGPDPEVTPSVLDILDAHGAKATFFCIANRIVAHPALTRELVDAQRAIALVTGSEPLFFRAPAGVRSPLLDPALRRVGLRLASWTRRAFDTVNGNPQSVLDRLQRRLASGDILLLHDGHAARTPSGRPVIIEVLPPLLDAIRDAGLKTVTLREGVR